MHIYTYIHIYIYIYVYIYIYIYIYISLKVTRLFQFLDNPASFQFTALINTFLSPTTKAVEFLITLSLLVPSL